VDPDAALSTSANPALQRNGNGMMLSPVVSSMRDQTPPLTVISRPPSPPTDAVPIQTPSPVDPLQVPASTTSLTQTLLQATLKLEEPAPPPEARAPSAATNWGVGAIARSQQAKPKSSEGNSNSKSKSLGSGKVKEELSIGQMVRLKKWPLDLAVSAARLQMGQGGDIGEEGSGIPKSTGDESLTIEGSRHSSLERV